MLSRIAAIANQSRSVCTCHIICQEVSAAERKNLAKEKTNTNPSRVQFIRLGWLYFLVYTVTFYVPNKWMKWTTEWTRCAQWTPKLAKVTQGHSRIILLYHFIKKTPKHHSRLIYHVIWRGDIYIAICCLYSVLKSLISSLRILKCG